ncbi:MAG TPA: hypothetical protein C5S51_04860 [Methanosarcinaceae archaeon]|nr:hypothetical protein [Methanosarcinaceae archaeon]
MTTKLLKCTLTDKNEIIAYAEFYDFVNKSESKLEKSILKEAQTVECADDLFKLLLDKDKGILKWKGALRIKRYFEDEEYWNSSRKEEFLNLIRMSCDDYNVNEEIVTELIEYKGIYYPMASTIVYFFSQGKCPIIDWRAIQTLNELNYDVNNDDWDGYFETCFKAISNSGIRFRDLDKALWIYQDVKKYLTICEELNRLNIGL